jgi:hypothetical protein
MVGSFDQTITADSNQPLAISPVQDVTDQDFEPNLYLPKGAVPPDVCGIIYDRTTLKRRDWSKHPFPLFKLTQSNEKIINPPRNWPGSHFFCVPKAKRQLYT